ncbi:hypothetical protein GMA10_05960 [Kocuria koreensis]|uniref:Uncharacterized protein n=1 Tax=Rothia koreensis TaxID=592378 RepID=A0A7K1LHT7_9MICC|nr:hypothetical protein [Rothia koreensis]MUN54757.1 hypothetical protein [Rothia koreensis]
MSDWSTIVSAVGALTAGMILVICVQLATALLDRVEADTKNRNLEEQIKRMESALRICAVTGMTYDEALKRMEAMK